MKILVTGTKGFIGKNLARVIEDTYKNAQVFSIEELELNNFDWDKEYQGIVDFYANLALKRGWIDYIRHAVKQKQESEPIFKNLGKDVAKKLKELECEEQPDVTTMKN